MQCDICFRTGGSKLPFLCPTDARNAAFELRVQHAQVLLEKDSLDRQVTASLSPERERPEGRAEDRGNSIRRYEVDSQRAGSSRAEDRTKEIIAQADKLQVNIDSARDELAKLKASNSRRKSELASAQNGIDARRIRQTEEVEKQIRIRKYKWNQEHSTMASSRTYLCGEAAKLYGLKKTRRNSGTEDYKIGGVSIANLRALNRETPANISTALSHIVHLLVLSTHYLAIRLPAEITLPHRDYPMPTIFPLDSSYKYSDVPFPGSTLSHSSGGSPADSKHVEAPTQSRPRPLFVKTPLPKFATEDTPGYGLFIEGITLLAYNVAWVCKSQGIPVGEEGGFEDICNIGRNLYNLLIGPRSRPPSGRNASTQSTPSKNGRGIDTETDDRKNVAPSIMGKWSHGTAHSNLGSTEGSKFIRDWILLNPTKLADKLKSQLLSEVANAEWEMLDPEAWQVEDEMGGDGVVVGDRRERERGLGLGMQSFMSMRTVMDATEFLGGGEERKPGTSGWTKLKPR